MEDVVESVKQMSPLELKISDLSIAGKSDEAIDLLLSKINDPTLSLDDRAEARVWMASMYAGFPDEAIDFLKPIINSDEIKPNIRGLMKFEYGSALYRKKSYEEAIPYLEGAIPLLARRKRYQNYSKLRLGICYVEKGQPGNAIPLLGEVVNAKFISDAYKIDARLYLGIALSLEKKKTEALVYLVSVLKNPSANLYQKAQAQNQLCLNQICLS